LPAEEIAMPTLTGRSSCRQAALLLALGCLLSGCSMLDGAIAGVAGATLIGARSPSHEIEQVYYLGVFDPDDQVPPSLYRLTVRGQASFISAVQFASGWVPAQLVDSLETRIQFKEKSTELEFTTGDPGRHAKLTPGRRLMLFGPEGFREAPADHRLVVVMGSNADRYFQSVEQVLGAVAAAKREQALTPEARQADVIKRLLELSEEQGRIQRLKADFGATGALPAATTSSGGGQ
jgi:hypothetical protein